METQYRIRVFRTNTKEEIGSPFITTDKRYALVVASGNNKQIYHTLETRECPDWEPARVPSVDEVRYLIDSGELV